MQLQNNKVKKKSTGLYLPEAVISDVAEIASRNELSVNETMTQLLQLGIEAIKGKGKAND